MFEVFAVLCFVGKYGLIDCQDFVLDALPDPLSCEVVAQGYRKDLRYVDVACIPDETIEPMP